MNNINDEYIIKNFFGKSGKLNGNYSTKKYLEANYPDVLQYLENRFDDAESLREIFLRILFKIEHRPKCPICGKLVLWRGRRCYLFNDTCGNPKCYCGLRDIKMMDKYGMTNLGGTEESIEKIRKTKEERYGDGGYNNKEKRFKTNQERYGSNAAVNSEIIEKRRQTCIEHFGVSAPAKSKIVLNKMKNTCLFKYGVDNYRKSEECIKKIQETKRKNGTVNSSKYEKEIYKWLVDEYGKNDIICQYKDERYKNLKNNHTYNCDFYIKSLDLFIEIQAYWGHGPHPFNPNDENDISLLEKTIEKAKNKPIYNRLVVGWTIIDVEKRNIAIQNNLKFFECFDRHITKEKFLNIIHNNYGNIQENNILWYYCE